jgi:hypothetical protein
MSVFDQYRVGVAGMKAFRKECIAHGRALWYHFM